MRGETVEEQESQPSVSSSVDEVMLEEYEALWKETTDGDDSSSLSTVAADKSSSWEELEGGVEIKEAKKDGEALGLSLDTLDDQLPKDDTTQPIGSDGLPKPLYLLSIQIKADEVNMHAMRQDMLARSYKSGLVNAVLLEDSELPSKMLMEPAAKLRETCDALGLMLIIENRVDVAVNCRAEGVVLDQGLDLESTRTFLDLSSARDAPSPKTMDVDGATVPRRVFCGRMISSTSEAQDAEEESVDFVMVVPPENKDAVDERSMLMELQDIQRATKAHVVATHEYCMQAGGPKMIFTSGADGLQIPAQKLYKLIMEQVTYAQRPKELPPASRIVGATLLIAGGTVGAGIIALPVKTALAGFIPSMTAMAACWLFMVTTAMLLLELSLWYGPGTNLTTMADNTLGKVGKTVVTCLYLFIYGATLTAYMAEGAKFTNMALTAMGLDLPVWSVVTAFATAFGTVLFAGPDPTDKVNSLCLGIAISAYVVLLKIAASSVLVSNLARANWSLAPAALPVMVVAFTFHNIVPSLLSYLGSKERVVKAILAGSGIPFIMYFIWELVILGTIPPGATLTSANQIVEQLGAATGGSSVVLCVKVFSFFAIITSFLGVGLGCIDFLKDLLMKEGGPFARQVSAGSALERLVALLTTLVPPLIIACAAPGIFYSALEFSGTFRLVLFGLIPVMMVWKGRYVDNKPAFLKGGKLILGLVALIAMTVLGVEWGGRLGLISR